MMKVDIADGFYRVGLAPEDVPSPGVCLPSGPDPHDKNHPRCLLSSFRWARDGVRIVHRLQDSLQDMAKLHLIWCQTIIGVIDPTPGVFNENAVLEVPLGDETRR